VSLARRLRTAALYTVVAGSVFFAAGELLSRAYNLPDRVNGFSRRLYVATDDPHLPYLLRPGFVGMVRSVPVRVNELGLRGPSAEAVPAPGVHRVLALGDSATFGEGLRVEEAFPTALERELNERSGERWEVLNAGVPGHNTEAELAFLRERGLALHPEALVLLFNLNDFDWAPVIGPLGVLTLDTKARVSTWSPANVSEFYLALRWLVITRGQLWGMQARSTAAAPFNPGADGKFGALDRGVSAMRKAYYLKPSDGRWQTMADALHGLGSVARDHHLPLVVAVLPDGDQFEGETTRVPQVKLLQLCAEAHLDCIDLYPAFAAAGGSDLYLNIMHPNAAGQRVIAHVLAERLLRDRPIR
jgi:lysophospholipase L1-like esterase